ncbi:hypothetical protein HDV63DRAFT_390165 [Trichoderma sp. SZMC 28014]
MQLQPHVPVILILWLCQFLLAVNSTGSGVSVLDFLGSISGVSRELRRAGGTGNFIFGPQRKSAVSRLCGVARRL